MFSKGYLHLTQPIYIRVQIGTHQRFCLQLIFYIVHLRKHGYTAYIAYKRNKKATFCKDYVHCLLPIYILLQVGTIAYLVITENNLILYLEISAYNAYTGYKRKLEEDIFSEGYIHLLQPIYIRVRIGKHQRLCLQLIFYIEHLGKRGKTALSTV